MITISQKVQFLTEQIASTRHLQENMTSNMCAQGLHNRLRMPQAILEDCNEGETKLEVVR